MSKPKHIPVFTEDESFANKKFQDFYIATYRDKEPEYLNRVEAHRHTYFEIIWALQGKGVHTIDFVDYKYEGPCLFLLHPRNIHTIKKECASEGGVVKFTRSLFSSDLEEGDFLLTYGVFDDIDVLPVINLKTEEGELIHKFFMDLVDEYKKKSTFSKTILSAYLKIFLLKIYEIKKRDFNLISSSTTEFKRFKAFQFQLDKNYKLHHEVAFFAATLNISPKTLSNATQNLTLKSPKQLINERIVLEAKRLLYHSGLTVKEIAYELGFKDSSYFTRFFKKNGNTNPSDYRHKS